MNFNYLPRLRGIGSSLSLLSLLNQLDVKVNLFNTHSNQLVREIYSVFLNNESIDISDTKNDDPINELYYSEVAKFFSKYPKNISNKSKYQKCIGISFFKDVIGKSQRQIDEYPYWPNNRSYALETVDPLIHHLKTLGFKVIYLDSRKHDETFADRVRMLKECCAVISYEGGNANLAHALEIPVIMWYWHTTPHPPDFLKANNQEDDIAKGYYDLEMWPEALHLDKKTKFIKHPDELLQLDRNGLLQIVNDLNDNKGNNYFLAQQQYNFTGMERVKRRGLPAKGLNDCLVLSHQFKDREAKLIMTEQEFLLAMNHMQEMKIGGVVPTNARELYLQSFNQ